MKRTFGWIVGLLICFTPLAALAQKTNKPNVIKPLTMPDSIKIKPSKNIIPASQDALADAVVTESLRELWAQSDEHFHEGEYMHAVNIYRIIVQGDPRNVEAFSNGAYLLWSSSVEAKGVLKTSLDNDARLLIEQGIQANPDNYFMWDEMGEYYWVKHKDPVKAIPFYEKAADPKRNPPATPTLHMLANCYERTNQWAKAVNIWRRAAEYPNNLQARSRLGRAEARLAQLKR